MPLSSPTTSEALREWASSFDTGWEDDNKSRTNLEEVYNNVIDFLSMEYYPEETTLTVTNLLTRLFSENLYSFLKGLV